MSDNLHTDLARLREPFTADRIGKLPKSNIEIDYVGHGAVTERLLEVDPEWNWEPLAYDDKGLPLFTIDGQGNPIAFWIKLTVCGVTRLGCGTCSGKQFDAEKVLIGDALRNAAMRFGVALDLWIKGHAEDDERRADTGNGPSRRKAEPPLPEGWKDRAEQHAEFQRLSDLAAARKAADVIAWAVDQKIQPDTFTIAERDTIESMLVGDDEPAPAPVPQQRAWPTDEEPF